MGASVWLRIHLTTAAVPIRCGLAGRDDEVVDATVTMSGHSYSFVTLEEYIPVHATLRILSS
jgi:hypothetical protein